MNQTLKIVSKSFLSLITHKAACCSRCVQHRSGGNNIYTSTVQQNIFSNPNIQNHGYMICYEELIYLQY